MGDIVTTLAAETPAPTNHERPFKPERAGGS
jgi:hypothetical protein